MNHLNYAVVLEEVGLRPIKGRGGKEPAQVSRE